MTTVEVHAELVAGIAILPDLSKAIALPWVEVVELDDIAMVVAFARYKQEFGGGADRNNGESAGLAWAEFNDGIAIVDDEVARGTATRNGIAAHGSLWLIALGVRDGKLRRGDAENLVDDLIATGMRLPIDGQGLFAWAYAQGLLPP